MKDLPHHIKKLNRQIVRSMHREEIEEQEYPEIPRKDTVRQVKKKAKAKLKAVRKGRIPSSLTPDERNKKMKKRVPVFDRNNAKPKSAKASKKKTPRI